ncbi:MAG: hypothetical protein WCR30_01955 [Clostridia bacterium]
MLESLKDFFLGDTVRRNDYLFDTPHLVTLIIVVFITISLIIVFKNKSKKQKDVFLWVVWSILLAFEILSRLINLIKGKDLITTLLPFHFCSIMVWVFLFTIPIKNKHLYNISAMGGLVATTAFLLYPAVGFNVEVLKFSQYYSVISHSLGFMLSVFVMAEGYTSFEWKNAWSICVFLVVVYAHSFLCNYIFYPGSNYMFYVDNPLPGNWGSLYVPFYIFAVVIYFLNFFVIYNLKQKRKIKR